MSNDTAIARAELPGSEDGEQMGEKKDRKKEAAVAVAVRVKKLNALEKQTQ